MAVWTSNEQFEVVDCMGYEWQECPVSVDTRMNGVRVGGYLIYLEFPPDFYTCTQYVCEPCQGSVLLNYNMYVNDRV